MRQNCRFYLDNKQTLPKFFTKGFPGVPGVTGPVIPRNFDVKRTLLNSNIHRSTVTGANLHIPILPLILRSRSAQRRLRLGYGRAARILDMMYRDGVIGPPDGSKPREVLKRPEWLREVDHV